MFPHYIDSASQFFYILISSYLLDKTGLLFSFYIFFSLPFCIKFFLEKVNLKSLTKLKSVARATSAYDINSVKDSPSMDQFYILSVIYQTPPWVSFHASMFLLNHDLCSCTLLLIIADSIFGLVTLFRVGSGGTIILDGHCAVVT